MINAKEASEMIEKMSPEDRLKALQNEVSESTKNALESEILKAVASYKKKVDVTLKSDICTDDDEKIRNLLRAMWYKNINVTSDFPGYNESYTGTTTVKFTF